MPRIAIMQPYVFPYIGYFQLIRAVDIFVFYNDVSFIKKGWIHRNRILLNGKDFLFTIPCVDASQNKRICDVAIAWSEGDRLKWLTTIAYAYKKAPFFKPVYAILEHIVANNYTYIDELAIASVREVCTYLGIRVNFTESKDRYSNSEIKREDRLIDICGKENCAEYINPIGGQEIYTREYFEKRGVDLKFLKPQPVSYDQFNSEFVPWLSIIDVLMFNDQERIMEYLERFELI